MRYSVMHETCYRYASPVALGHQLLHLTPRALPWQTVLSHTLQVEPQPEELQSSNDYFGNPVTHVVLCAPHRELRVLASSVVAVDRGATDAAATSIIAAASGVSDGLVTGLLPGATPSWREVAASVAAASNLALLRASEFLYDSPHVQVVPAVREYANASFAEGCSVLQVALDLNRRIHHEFVFDPRATSVSTPVETVLSERRGVCQDFAHLMVACLRAGGLAARYVSGYILTEPPPGQPRLVGADASHAWVSVYCPTQGWVDLDPTNNLTVGDAHVTLAWGRDFGDVTPMRGVILGGGEQEIEVRVTVHPLD